MKDNLSIVITMLIFVILIVIFPLYNYFERQDDMSYNLALKATTNFVDEVLQAGYLDQDMYERYVNQLGNTGNIYDIQVEGHRKKLIQDVDNTTKYNEQFFIDYNDNIFSETNETGINSNLNGKKVKADAYYLNEGDQFYVKLKNSNTTMAGAIFNTIVPTAKKERIVVNYGGVIKNQAWSKVDATYKGHANISSNAPTVTFEKISGKVPESTEIPADGLILYPTNSDYVSKLEFAATGPEMSSWWNKVASYSWQLDYGDRKVINAGENFVIEKLSSGTHTLRVSALDEAGNETDIKLINIEVTDNISGGTGSGGFTNLQELVLGDTPIFLNAYPKGYDLTVYLGNKSHAYSGDQVIVYGTNSEAKITNISDPSLVELQKYTLGSLPKNVDIKIIKNEPYTYGGKTFEEIFKVNLKCDKLNPSNEYKRFVIYYKNQHPNCVLKISDTVGGAYDYTIEYGI